MKATLRLVGIQSPDLEIPREPYVAAVVIAESETGRQVPLRLHPLTPQAGERVLVERNWRGKRFAAVDPKPADRPLTVKISEDSPLEVDVLLYEGDPGRFLAAYGVVYQSFDGYLDASDLLDGRRAIISATNLGVTLSGGNRIFNSGAAAALAEDVFEPVGQILLGARGDNALLAFRVTLDGENLQGSKSFAVEAGSFRCAFEWSVTAEEGKRAEVAGADAPPSGNGDNSEKPGSSAPVPAAAETVTSAGGPGVTGTAQETEATAAARRAARKTAASDPSPNPDETIKP